MFGPSVAWLFWNPSVNCIQVCGCTLVCGFSAACVLTAHRSKPNPECYWKHLFWTWPSMSGPFSLLCFTIFIFTISVIFISIIWLYPAFTECQTAFHIVFLWYLLNTTKYNNFFLCFKSGSTPSWDFSSIIPVFLNALSSFCDFCVCTQHCSLMPVKGDIKGRLPMLIGTVALRAQGTATSDDMQVDKTQAK